MALHCCGSKAGTLACRRHTAQTGGVASEMLTDDESAGRKGHGVGDGGGSLKSRRKGLRTAKTRRSVASLRSTQVCWDHSIQDCRRRCLRLKAFYPQPLHIRCSLDLLLTHVGNRSCTAGGEGWTGLDLGNHRRETATGAKGCFACGEVQSTGRASTRGSLGTGVPCSCWEAGVADAADARA